MNHQKSMQRKKPLPAKELEEEEHYITRKEKFVKKFGKKGKIKIKEKVK